MHHRDQNRLTDLERRAFRHMMYVHRVHFPGVSADTAHMTAMARAAVEALTTGSASGRRVRISEQRVPDPGSTPAKIRELARKIEGSFHTMPNGWVSADKMETKHE